jgi:hypothetical protein
MRLALAAAAMLVLALAPGPRVAAEDFTKRACVDAAGHAGVCHPQEGALDLLYYECRASGPDGRCPGDPFCVDDGQRETQCVRPVALATARCTDGALTASPTPETACAAHRGVAER